MTKYNSISHYLQLIEVFTFREIKARYRASLLGPIWIILYPLITAALLSMVFGYFIKINIGNIPYFLFVLSGIVFWNFFQQSLNIAIDSLVWNRDLIIKTSFAKSILPLSYVLSKVPDYFVYFILFFIFYVFHGYHLRINSFFIFLLIIPLVLFTSGIALLISLIHSVFRDFGRLVEFALLVLFYITPIVYSDASIPEKYKIIVYINPIALLILFCRRLLFQNIFQLDLIIRASVISVLIFLLGFYVFQKFEKRIVDLI